MKGKLSLLLVLTLSILLLPVFLSSEATAMTSPLSPLPGYEDLPPRPLPPDQVTHKPEAKPDPEWAFVGLWWSGPETACELYSNGVLYTLRCP